MYENVKEVEKRFQKSLFPLNLAIEVGNHCNLNCIMCCNDKIHRKKGFMSIDLYKKIIDEVSEKSPYSRIWLDFYGEPLLIRYKLYYMIDYAKKKGLKNICMNTNATLLNEEMTEMLLDSEIDFISFDVYGYSKEVLEQISVGANRDQIYNNVEYFLKRKRERGLTDIVAEVKVLELEENRHEIEKILEYWTKKGAWITVRRAISWGGGAKTAHDLPEERVACGHAVGTCAITWEGDVVTCSLDADGKTIYGNVNRLSIEEIWKKRNKELVDRHLKHEFDEIPDICKTCSDWTIIGEMRFDENGHEVKKSYNLKDKMIQKQEV